ncbi:MAG: DUF268 domain-containing protein [Hydrotalea sp.]|nr:DUF268 domain-containing protein [Hydrotalea sp.]
MKKILKSINKRTWRKFRQHLAFKQDKKKFAAMLLRDQPHHTAWPLAEDYPIMDEKKLTSGDAGGHYFHQDLLVAQWLFKNKPRRHLDVGSRIDGFIAHVASYREIDVMDIRPQKKTIPNVRFIQRDLMLPIKTSEREKFDSISCLHTLEHFGLGRYGDTIDPLGDKKGMAHLLAMLQKNGYLYFSVPMGKQRVAYNAHRIYNATYLLDWFKDMKLKVINFSYVDDHDNLHKNVRLAPQKISQNYGVNNYGCAIFQLQKTA